MKENGEYRSGSFSLFRCSAKVEFLVYLNSVMEKHLALNIHLAFAIIIIIIMNK